MSSCLQNVQLACAVCRIVVCSQMCCRKQSHQAIKSFEVICVGLTGAGKTTLLNTLTRQTTDDITPTTGFRIKACQMDECILNMKEIGGASEMCQYWKHYYKASQAVVFVVDSASDDEELERAAMALENALRHPDLSKVPCLIIGNCQDKLGARNEDQLQETLHLEGTCSDRQWTLGLCSKNDYDAIYSAFSKLASFLKTPENSA